MKSSQFYIFSLTIRSRTYKIVGRKESEKDIHTAENGRRPKILANSSSIKKFYPMDGMDHYIVSTAKIGVALYNRDRTKLGLFRHPIIVVPILNAVTLSD